MVLHYNRLEVLSISLSLSFFLIPTICQFPPLYRHVFCPYPSSCLVSSRILKDIFPPLPCPETLLLGVFPLFRLSHMHSMRKRLGGDPLINAEVKISAILICLEGFS